MEGFGDHSFFYIKRPNNIKFFMYKVTIGIVGTYFVNQLMNQICNPDLCLAGQQTNWWRKF